MNTVHYYSDSVYKQIIKQASDLNLSSNKKGLISTIAKLINSTNEYPEEAIKHVYETFIILCDNDGCLHYLFKNPIVTLHRSILYDNGYILIVTSSLSDWRTLIIANARLSELNQIQVLLERKYPRLFNDYTKVKKNHVFELVKK